MAGIQETDGVVDPGVSGGEVTEVQTTDTPQVQESTSDTSGGESTETIDPKTLKESARETVSRLAREMVGEKPKEEAVSEETKVVRPAKEAKAKIEETESPDDKFDSTLLPPNRLSPEGKAFFDKSPKWVKKEITKTLRDLESGTEKIVGQAKQAMGSVKSIVDAVQPFAASWAKRHVSVAQGVTELCGMYANLSDPKKAAQEYIDLGNKLGIDFEQLAQAVKSGQVPNVGQQKNENNPLQERINGLESKLTEWQTQQAVQPIVNEMARVKYEVDPNTGKYRYPELHDGAYLQSLSERVTELVEKFGQTHADSLKRANAEKKQALFGIPIQPQVSKPHTASASNNNINQRAVSAAVTVRGKTSPLLANNGGSQEPPLEALKSAKATTAWVLQNMKNGGGA